jgi:uncharacterized protein (DUF1919 family)
MKFNSSLACFWDECHNKKTPLVIFGTGEQADAYSTILRFAGIVPVYFVDVTCEKLGAFFKNVEIKGFDSILSEIKVFDVLVAVAKDTESTVLQLLDNRFKDLSIEYDITVFCLPNKGSLSAELLTYYRKSQLVNKDFSIISNSCFAFDIYGYLDMEPKTPTSQMIIYPLHFIKFLKNLDYYLSLQLEYKHRFVVPRQEYKVIGVEASLGDIDVYFVHDDKFESALERWNAGVASLNRDNLFVVMEDAHFPLTRKIAEEFDALPYKNKILLTTYDYGDLKSVCRYSNDTNWLRLVLNINHYIRYERFDFVKWFNNGGQGKDYEIRELGDNLPQDFIDYVYSGVGNLQPHIYDDALLNKYPYAMKDLLQNPITYEFSKFEGTDGLRAYETDREKVLWYLLSEQGQSDHKLSFDSGLSTSLTLPDTGAPQTVRTQNLFVVLLEKLIRGANTPADNELVLRFIKKFEVSKKLYDCYEVQTYKKASDRYSNIVIYLLFANVLGEFIGKPNTPETKLIAFNTMLKVNDTLSSLKSKIKGNTCVTLALRSFKREQEIYSRLVLNGGFA